MSNGLVSGNAQNGAGGNTPHNRSKFNLAYQFFDTHRFGEYHPFFVMECVDSDRVGTRCSHDVRSYTLKAPLMQDIKMKKDFFSVPMQAILPFNWEKFYTNPVIGDDVPDDCGTGSADFWLKYSVFYNGCLTGLGSVLSSSSSTSEQIVMAIIRCLVVGEYVYSNGSLLSSLGVHGAPFLQFRDSVNNASYDRYFDYFFDQMISELVGTNIKGFFVSDQIGLGVDDTRSYYVDVAEELKSGSVFTIGQTSGSVISIRQCLEFFRDEPSLIVSSVNLGTVTAANFRTALNTRFGQFTYFFHGVSSAAGTVPTPLNISRLWAYQLCCSHFYSNDHVDYIYSANLFREYIGNTLNARSGSGSFSFPDYFVANGLSYQYDYLSAHYFNTMIVAISNYSSFLTTVSTSTTTSLRYGTYSYLAALFSYKRSLRFLDYFTGSRSRPLAIGDVNVDVNTSAGVSSVNVIDVTRNIQRQRFFNAVNRAGRKFSSYMSELFGKAPAHDWHDPLYLGHTADVVFGSEVENTGAAQQTQAVSVTSTLRSNASRYGFEFDCDRDCIVLGICYYDLSRNYSRTIERQNFYMNRFDMFNPYMQFIGDQPIYAAELSPTYSPFPSFTDTFAYQNRHMEYKQRYNQCAGGFVTELPSWLFIADQDLFSALPKINPSYIRSHPSELDRFYVSLSGYSLGTYFHFIVRSTNEVTASRPMAYAPSIL